VGLGATVTEMKVAFEPEAGAYAGGHHHHDDEEHGHAHGAKIHHYGHGHE
jgi:urease accessory protein